MREITVVGQEPQEGSQVNIVDRVPILTGVKLGSKKAMLQALEMCLNIVSAACKVAKVSRAAHYKWMHADPEYRQAVEELENTVLDFVETKLHKAIDKGDVYAITFYLKTKGRKRGYIEKAEITATTISVTVTE
jgi:hypothetical protein